jgi:hypothetical protein
MTSEEMPKSDNEEKSTPIPDQAAKSSGPCFAEPEKPMADLSAEIAKFLPRSARQRVTCRRIVGNSYRCNWWTPQDTSSYDNPSMTGLTVTTHRVTKSEVLHVTKTAQGLVIK